MIGGILAGAAQLAVFCYLFMALRRVYGGSRAGTLLRTFLLIAGYTVVLACVGVLSTPWLAKLLWASLWS